MHKDGHQIMAANINTYPKPNLSLQFGIYFWYHNYTALEVWISWNQWSPY